MYIVNRVHQPKRPVRAAILTVLIVGGLIGSGATVWNHIKPETTIGATPAPVVRQVLGTEEKTKKVTAGRVSFNLPVDWEQYKNPELPNYVLSWRNTAGNKGVQVLDLYMGTTKPDLAINRVLAVEAAGDHMLANGSVSDNCTEFAASGRKLTGSGKEPARWSGVQFICDTANYNRSVVGIASADGPNVVKLAGPSGPLELFMTYTDASISPKFGPLMTVVDSLRVK